jgi:hypothetical protein
MLGVAGVLGQEILRPDVFWYEAGLPENLPGPFKNINMGGLLAWEFLLMHWVEVRRWQDYKNFGSVNEVRCSAEGEGGGWAGGEQPHQGGTLPAAVGTLRAHTLHPRRCPINRSAVAVVSRKNGGTQSPRQPQHS